MFICPVDCVQFPASSSLFPFPYYDELDPYYDELDIVKSQHTYLRNENALLPRFSHMFVIILGMEVTAFMT